LGRASEPDQGNGGREGSRGGAGYPGVLATATRESRQRSLDCRLQGRSDGQSKVPAPSRSGLHRQPEVAASTRSALSPGREGAGPPPPRSGGRAERARVSAAFSELPRSGTKAAGMGGVNYSCAACTGLIVAEHRTSVGGRLPSGAVPTLLRLSAYPLRLRAGTARRHGSRLRFLRARWEMGRGATR